MKIYVASSWRNEFQQDVVKKLRDAGYQVYDFKNPHKGNKGFHWSEIDPNWENWSSAEYRGCLNHPIAENGYRLDYSAMIDADIFVGVQPFGRSASMEMGWAAGRGRHTILLLHDGEPELMVKMFDHICTSIDEVLSILNDIRIKREELDSYCPST